MISLRRIGCMFFLITLNSLCSTRFPVIHIGYIGLFSLSMPQIEVRGYFLFYIVSVIQKMKVDILSNDGSIAPDLREKGPIGLDSGVRFALKHGFVYSTRRSLSLTFQLLEALHIVL